MDIRENPNYRQYVETIIDFVNYSNEGTDGFLNTDDLSSDIAEDALDTGVITKEEFSDFENTIRDVADSMIEDGILGFDRSEYDGFTILKVADTSSLDISQGVS